MKMCKRCHGMHKIVIGALLLLNAYIWPLWNGIDGWIKWIAVLMVVGGLVKLLVPNKCSACNACSSMPKKKGKK
jgi:hypothetical protein